MNAGFLLDEHVPPWWRRAILQRYPHLKVWCIGDPPAPPRGTSDPVILEWCEGHGFILVTDNRTTMPGHLANHLSHGRHVPGIVVIGSGMGVNDVALELALIDGASFAHEFQDLIRFMPLS